MSPHRILHLLLLAGFAPLIWSGCGGKQASPASGPPASPQDQPATDKTGTGPAADTIDPALLAQGRKAWRACATCHCATEPAIAQDRDWEALNEETTCIEGGDPAPRLRKAIIGYLHDPETLRPVYVDAAYKPKEGRPTGKILAPPTSGSAYLKATRDSVKSGSPSMVRLYWKESESEKSLTTPTGDYVVINYWLYRNRGENDRWMVSATNVDGCSAILIEPDSEAYMNLDAVLYGEYSATEKDGIFTLSFSLHDMGGNRLTLSKNGRVVMPRYRILDGTGKKVVEGVFEVI